MRSNCLLSPILNNQPTNVDRLYPIPDLISDTQSATSCTQFAISDRQFPIYPNRNFLYLYACLWYPPIYDSRSFIIKWHIRHIRMAINNFELRLSKALYSFIKLTTKRTSRWNIYTKEEDRRYSYQVRSWSSLIIFTLNLLNFLLSFNCFSSSDWAQFGTGLCSHARHS